MQRQCWAECLGDCGGAITKEHYISESFFSSKTVMVRGLPFCKEQAVEVGLDSLSQKMLCARHNNRLGGDVDKVASEALNKLMGSHLLQETRNRDARHRHYNVLREKIDGRLLERWLLKTLINLSFGKGFGIGEGAKRKGWPTDELVRIVFGLAFFKEESGLYTVAKVGDNIHLEERIQFQPIQDSFDDHNIVAANFSFCGYRYLLHLRRSKPEYAQAPRPIYHTRKIVWNAHNNKGKEVRSNVIDWKW